MTTTKTNKSAPSASYSDTDETTPDGLQTSGVFVFPETPHEYPTQPLRDISALPHHSPLVLSLFPGIDLLGRGFEHAGFCVVRGPDHLWGGDIRHFNPPPNRFAGVIAGSPCQDFSSARRTAPTGYGRQMLYQFARVVSLAQPLWWLLENVPRAPAVEIAGYNTQRLEMSAWEFGLDQSRRRHFQFGSHSSRPLVVPRPLTTPPPLQPAVTASENRRTHKRPYAAFCGLMGFPPIDLPPFKSSARYQAVGNGVPFPIALAIAHAIAEFWREVPSLFPGINIPAQSQQACPCGCGRPISGDQLSATPACRKRLQRQRHGIYPGQSHSQQPH